MNNAIRFFLIGSGIGAGTALLLAPQPGRRLRAKMRVKAVRSAMAVKRSGKEVRNQAVAALQAGRRAYKVAVGA